MLNNINIIGYLAHDPDLRATPTGKSICRFAIGNTRPKAATKDREVDFIDIVCLYSTADFVKKWFHKGDPIVVTGRLQSQVQVQNDGRSIKKYEILAGSVDFCPTQKVPTDGEVPF